MDKKKIGIAAVTYKENFGSALQTYATQYVLEKLGYEARIFEIKGIHKSIHFKKLAYYASRLFDPIELKYLLANLISRSRKSASASSDQYAQDMKVRKLAYSDFNKRWNKMLPVVNSWNELKSQASTMDITLVGSDQNWRPSNIVGGFFTLEFVPEHIKKISFSTSFGVFMLKSIFVVSNTVTGAGKDNTTPFCSTIFLSATTDISSRSFLLSLSF